MERTPSSQSPRQPPRAPARDGVLRGAREVAEAARRAGLISAAVGATTEAVNNLRPLVRGEIDGVHYVGRVLGTASSAGSATVAKATAALALRETVKAVARRLESEGLRRAASSAPGAAVTFGAVNQAIETTRLLRRRIDRREYGLRTAENVVGTGGGLGGAALGAALGSVLPGPGTAIGALLGGVAGGIAGARTGRAVGEKLIPEPRDPSHDER